MDPTHISGGILYHLKTAAETKLGVKNIEIRSRRYLRASMTSRERKHRQQEEFTTLNEPAAALTYGYGKLKGECLEE